MNPLTQSYAQRIASSAAHPVPQAVASVAVLGFTDAIGVMLAGAQEDAVCALARWALEQGGAAQSRGVCGAARMPAAHAALVNATAAHALDYDDFAFSNHPSAVLVPAILAAADAHPVPVPGATLIRAYAIGYEVWCDVFVRERDLYYDKGWHPTSVLGTLGAAAAASVVWGLDARQCSDALALAASNAGGIFENFGTMAKPYHGGRAASVGVTAASMARHGLHASATAIEGSRGMLRAFSPHGNLDLERPAPGPEDWQMATRRLNIKKYPVVGAAQRSIDAMLALRRRQPVDPGAVRSIVAHVSERHAAVMPYHLPQDALQAKFSLEYAIVGTLVHGAMGLAQLQDAMVCDPAVQSLMARVQTVTTDAFEPDWRDAAPFDQVHLHLQDGTTISTPPVRRATGHADTPLAPEEIHAKFMGCTRHAGLDTQAAEALYQSLQRLGQLGSAQEIPLPHPTVATTQP
ncbi:MAG: MmgE/PrpD family protein [Rhodoferax sp.]|nr:MmgE/PrpD family protein [Rhodoferax sp.]